ncbi:LysR family transcriptional regulator [Salmonella enterica subsp. enterica serovar Senftenberg]|uniref:LysR family transcriptional regulator n=6 Tax=Salmonella enterica I TaxID=59201 RepID=A0A707YZ20_SALTM|nr:MULTISPECIES: LysR family transcriptional regulator [Salmonella]EAA1509275.1 LysR family transcriptional regulator [Salmonella enterica subsp. enterica serovar Agama]EAA8813383.1 LysR family transcriptional regulator [Salmonella enterica subsp. enterica]EAC0143853.1 LysR family transcriptional regulator [Salmonella enterica subsp. enterica serovar Ajiobo]EAC0417879.1 LysR family transcriptional regulator [Salmonella enterica subsp. enterica serovar Apeyeme]EBC9932938.1 LysR family transcrip
MNLSITDDITFRKLTIFMMFVEKGNIARTAEALHTLKENVRCPLFVHKGLFGTRPGIKITVAVGSTGTEACVM